MAIAQWPQNPKKKWKRCEILTTWVRKINFFKPTLWRPRNYSYIFFVSGCQKSVSCIWGTPRKWKIKKIVTGGGVRPFRTEKRGWSWKDAHISSWLKRGVTNMHRKSGPCSMWWLHRDDNPSNDCGVMTLETWAPPIPEWTHASLPDWTRVPP